MVRPHELVAVAGKSEPQRDIGVPLVRWADRFRHREEKGGNPVNRIEVCFDAEFFDRFPPDGIRGVFTRFDMSAGRQPQT